jgi:hypothetical protein
LGIDSFFLFNYFNRLEKEKQLIKSEVDEAKLQTEHVNKAKVNMSEKRLNCELFSYKINKKKFIEWLEN